MALILGSYLSTLFVKIAKNIRTFFESKIAEFAFLYLGLTAPPQEKRVPDWQLPLITGR